ncbi:hypothetical protein FZEAL_1489 [Fusarium zealandicum]|uniref:Uncharacterized protein n=1 Tax=Fusarium zealandicum TaxID=1053134 RepID=A0A8H4USW3_9HYPO|nr:hypothetical protein FZEAL_1489 [Fusarium zealandicum]
MSSNIRANKRTRNDEPQRRSKNARTHEPSPELAESDVEHAPLCDYNANAAAIGSNHQKAKMPLVCRRSRRLRSDEPQPTDMYTTARNLFLSSDSSPGSHHGPSSGPALVERERIWAVVWGEWNAHKLGVGKGIVQLCWFAMRERIFTLG